MFAKIGDPQGGKQRWGVGFDCLVFGDGDDV